jgi:hypothetical protein
MTFIKGIVTLGAAMLIGLSVTPVQAGYVVDLTQVGSNVVATGSGPIDLTGLSFVGGGGGPGPSAMNPTDVAIITGAAAVTDVYIGATGPTSFGSGGFTSVSSGSGDQVGIDGINQPGIDGVIRVPSGYVSDSPLSDTATYASQTFASLGATPGRYEWTWGSGANQNFTLDIGTVVPEPSTWVMMALGFAGLGFMGYQSAGRRGSPDAA